MLLKFSKSDILNSSLTYPETGALGYTVLSRPHFIRGADKDSDTECEDDDSYTCRTVVCNKAGITVAEIRWKGRQPIEVIVGRERIAAKAIFGRQSAILSGNVLGIPTRFDMDFFWMATSDGLSLLEYGSNRIKGQFRTNNLRVGDRLITAPIPGLGHDYIEFEPHPSASMEELLVSFLLVEILRRSRFHPDPQDRRKLWRNTSLGSFSKRLNRSAYMP